MSFINGGEGWLPPGQTPGPAFLGNQPTERRRRWPYVVLALACLGAGVAGAAVWARGGEGSGPDHPSAWDPKVQPFVGIVERERHLEFEHPVYVDFLSQKKFRKQVTTDDQDITDQDRTELRRTTSMFRALGLVEGKLDLFESLNDLHGSGIVGYYSYDDERIRVRGTKLTPAVRSTLVHELTHALQDQHFDLGGRMETFEDNDDGQTAYQALVEGDARRIETEWRNGLEPKQQAALKKSETKQTRDARQGLKGVPEVFETLMSAPYAFGEAMLRIAVDEGGDRSVDDLFRTPPQTDEQLTDPWTLIADHEGYLNVDAPGLPEGEKAFDDGAFGALGWLIVLAERIPAEQAVTATDGWGGDSYVAFEHDGVSCVRAAYLADTPQDLQQMHTALTQWVRRSPNASASVRRDGSKLAFESCDPGTDSASVATGGSTQAVRLAVSRTYLSAQLKKTGMMTTPKARCSADRLVRAFTVAELNDPTVDPRRVRAVVAPCL